MVSGTRWTLLSNEREFSHCARMHVELHGQKPNIL